MGEVKRDSLEVSMARTGNPYENAVMASFFEMLKPEEVYSQKTEGTSFRFGLSVTEQLGTALIIYGNQDVSSH